eukprot:7627434-Pyramimonas_sp.AAC.1
MDSHALKHPFHYQRYTYSPTKFVRVPDANVEPEYHDNPCQAFPPRLDMLNRSVPPAARHAQ